MATIASATIIIVIGTICSNVFGVIKSVLVAKYFGIGAGLDAFYVSIILPMVLIGLVLGAMQSSIIPVFIEYKTKGKEEEGYRIFNSFFTLAIAIFLLLSLIMIFFSDFIISIVAPGFKDERFSLASNLLKIVAPIVLLGGAADLIGSIFNANKKFVVPAFGATVNVAVSLAYLILFKSQGVYALAIGLLLGSLAQCLYAIIGTINSGFKLGINFNFNSPGVKQIFGIMIPMFLGLTLSHANITVDQVMASLLTKGSIAALNYANNINNILSQLFIVSLGSAILPFLSQLVSEGRNEDLDRTFYTAIRMAAYILIPITVFILILAAPAIKIFLERGEFDHNSTLAVSGAWKAFSLGLFTFATCVITSRVFVSYRRTKPLAFVTFMSVFINIAFNFILMRYLHHVGIALSTSITGFLSAVLLIYLFNKKISKIKLAEIVFPVLRIIFYSLVAGSIMFFLSFWINIQNIHGISIVFFAGLITYLLLSWIGNLDELRILVGQRLSEKLIKTLP
ncbi:MAG: murein biosynthesis integral membrane protein MurJ [Nitrospirota bacterium]